MRKPLPDLESFKQQVRTWTIRRNAECAKINRVIAASSDYEALIAIDTSVQTTLERVIELEGILKAKLDSILPFLNECI